MLSETLSEVLSETLKLEKVRKSVLRGTPLALTIKDGKKQVSYYQEQPRRTTKKLPAKNADS